MINCKEATFLMAKKEEGKLSLVGRMKLSMHTSMCSLCKKFEKQSVKIATESKYISAEQLLSRNAKEKIEQKLKENPS